MGSVTGLDEIKRRLDEKIAAAVKAQGVALYMVANAIMTDSKEHTPFDLGPLQNSGYVSEPAKRGSLTVVEMGYGGPAAAYAVRQHEEMDWIHKRGEAKFLENAISRAMPTIASDMAGIFRAVLAGGSVGIPSGTFGPQQQETRRQHGPKAPRNLPGHAKTQRFGPRAPRARRFGPKQRRKAKT